MGGSSHFAGQLRKHLLGCVLVQPKLPEHFYGLRSKVTQKCLVALAAKFDFNKLMTDLLDFLR